jgi:hypothetical protein|tara:strand:+ start:403 stop:873 length:471 start_codon:yes stop_codon:yes gene_type:complete
MAYFAEIKTDTNTVIRVIVVSDSDVSNNGGDLSSETETWVANNIINDKLLMQNEGWSEYPNTYWKQTSKQKAFRKNYAGTDSTYDAVKDIFIPKQPYASWTLNVDNEWQPPVAIPLSDNGIIDVWWDEENQRWYGIKEDTGVNYVWSTINNEWEQA